MNALQAALVRSILEKHYAYEWTVQGFGFLRTKIENIGRIHVWDSRLSVPLVSTVHTHPWPLHSTVISGELINQRFICSEDESGGLPYLAQDIHTREGGGLSGTPKLARLRLHTPEIYAFGAEYSQAPEEIHRTLAQDGTVTLLERPQGPPLELARVFWPAGTSWVSAEPRPATGEEVRRTIQYALARWFTMGATELLDTEPKGIGAVTDSIEIQEPTHE